MNRGIVVIENLEVGHDSAEFSISPHSIRRLEPGAARVIEVTFKPQQEGVRPSLRLAVSGGQPFLCWVTGVGVKRPSPLAVLPYQRLVATGDSISFPAMAEPLEPSLVPGMVGTVVKYQWLRDGKIVPNATGAGLDITSARLADGGRYEQVVFNDAGSQLVYRGQIIVMERALKIDRPVAGVNQLVEVSVVSLGGPVTCEWSVDDPPPSLSRQPVIRLRYASPGRRLVSATVSTPITGEQRTTSVSFIDVVSQAPQISDPGPQSWTTNGWVNLQLNASGGASSFSAVGLPSGVTISQTGLVSGRPQRPGTYRVKVWAANPAGRSPSLEITVLVEPMDQAIVGRFVGTFAMHPELNDRLGGKIALETTGNGSFTASVQHATRVWRIAGLFDQISNSGGAIVTRMLPVGEGELPYALQIKIMRNGTSTATCTRDGHGSEAFLLKKAAVVNGIPPVSTVTLDISPLQRGITTPIPQSGGTMMIIINSSGIVRFSGRMGDNEGVVGSSIWSADGAVPLHRLLYGVGGGAVGGQCILAPSGRSARLFWIKKLNLDDAVFPEGWNPLALDVR